MKTSYKTLRLILGDQLNAKHSWYRATSKDIVYLIAELPQEIHYVRHHVQKVCAFFLAMENFAAALKQSGHQVLHLNLDDTCEWPTLSDLLIALKNKYAIQTFEYQRPDEFRLLQQMRSLQGRLKIDTKEYDTEHFLLPFDAIQEHFKAGKHVKMEFFYRKMRQRHNILMKDGKPEGGKWNYDGDNRSALKKNDLQKIPSPLTFKNDVSNILTRLKKHKFKGIGVEHQQLVWPCTRSQASKLLRYFCRECLTHFGTFQDAMTKNHEHHWSLFHSRLSFAINSKMLSPNTVIDTALKTYRESKGTISIAQIEGFIRQILGWREYVRGIYWANMPEYGNKNSLQAKRALPEYFWSGSTKMSCMQESIGQSLEYAYAHHIQRLMITGNFSLLCGIDPDQVDAWYLGIYIDAIEWVEMPNTRGMSQFADGGIVATKPYSASGNYINKMSDYCKGCHYNVKEKIGGKACPFNSLYWDFMVRHRDRFEDNPRIGMVYRNWDKQEPTLKTDTRKRAQWCLDNLEKL